MAIALVALVGACGGGDEGEATPKGITDALSDAGYLVEGAIVFSGLPPVEAPTGKEIAAAATD